MCIQTKQQIFQSLVKPTQKFKRNMCGFTKRVYREMSKLRTEKKENDVKMGARGVCKWLVSKL